MSHVNPDGWWSRAACRAVDPDLFFPVSTTGRDGQESRAKRVCDSCLVRAECLAYALDAGPILLGIWGGTSETERTGLRRAMRRTSLRCSSGGVAAGERVPGG
jgi:WhiB family redox-sensing transcriptional regulator